MTGRCLPATHHQYCSPTRSSLLSGRLPIHVNTANRAYDAKGGVDIRMTMIAAKLTSVGYKSHQVNLSFWNASRIRADRRACGFPPRRSANGTREVQQW